MPKMTDQEFDDLFRRAANRISPEHMPGDWDDMQHRLEAAERDARIRNISLYAMVALLFLYSFLMPEHLKPGNHHQASLVPAIEQSRSQTALSKEPGAAEATGNRSAEHAKSGERARAVNDKEVTNSRDENQQQQSKVSPTTVATISRDPFLAADEKQSRSGSTVVHNAALMESNQRTTTVALAEIASAAPRDGILPAGRSAGGGSFEHEFPEAPATDPLSASPEIPPITEIAVPGRITGVQAQTRHPWFLKLAVSPDFSSIDYGSAGKTGINFGPMVEYGISPRFSVSTGAVWSKKLYSQENPDKSYGQSGYPVQANMLNGDCRIIDIPLNITYYMLPGRKTNLFVTVGASSYIMLDEEYIYTVSRNNHDYEYVETYSNKNNEWFSMLNVSAGVQHQVGERWFVQCEPFLKAPMKGVGEGKVNLASAGVFVSVKYWINP